MDTPRRAFHPTWIAFGWFIAASASALVLLALAAAGIETGRPAEEQLAISVALLLGFGFGGFVVGTRVLGAPGWHALGIGLFSLVAWVLLNLLLGEPTGATTWRDLPLITVVNLLVLQTAAAFVGARVGFRWVGRAE